MKKLFLTLLIISALSLSACGGSSSGGGSDDNDDNGTDDSTACIDTDYSCDGLCDGPTVGQSPNDTDNTFHSLAVHPTDPNTVLIGNEGNGIFKSTDGGATWSRINDGIWYNPQSENYAYCMYPEIYQIIFDHTDANKLYAATTSGPGAEAASGFYYSTDSGTLWTRSVAGLHNVAVTSVAQDPTNTDVLYIGLDNMQSSGDTPTDNSGPNIYKSVDGGLTWTGLNLPVTNNRVLPIIVDPNDSNIIYCAGYYTNSTDDLSTDNLGFAKSIDAGVTWTRINTGLASLKQGYIHMDPNNPNTLYASVWGDQGVLSYKSTDAGANWTEFPASSTGIRISEPDPSPHDSNTIIGFTTQKIYRTTDGGTSWSESVDFSSENPSIVFKETEYTSDANMIYGSANRLKVFKSTDGGTSFSEVSGSISELVGH